MERTHEPCVPTCLLPANHPAIRPILKFNIQCPMFKAQVPTLPYRLFSAMKRHTSLHHMACIGPASRSGSFKFFLGLEPSVRTYQRKKGDIEAEGLPCRDVMAVERGARQARNGGDGRVHVTCNGGHSMEKQGLQGRKRRGEQEQKGQREEECCGRYDDEIRE